MKRLGLPALLPPIALLSCLGAEPTGPVSSHASEGAGLEIQIAALSLEGVGDVVWDLEVLNGALEVVWQRRVTSSGYGDSAGSATFVGACDADPAVNRNVVRVWVVGVYADDVPTSSAGAFSAGSTEGAGAVTGTERPFENPTTSGPLTREVTCLADQDVAVHFDVTLMRPASQGFFDIALNFNDLYCSAKLDCCADGAGDGCAPDGSEDIRLLFDETGARARTIVLGFACTAGTAADVVTEIYMDALALDCTAPNGGEDFTADLVLDPAAAATGNQCTAGPDGMTACAPIVAEPGGLDADDYLFQVATFRGAEALP
ncbi:MAG: hypothetical protein EP329_20600, partial [Deltaproteobacteria bacterium]